MSFIIKGIDIPKTCRQCPCCGDNGLVGMQRDYFCAALDCATSIDELDQKLTDCPLVEVPTPHGRLIDADTVEERLQKYWYEEYPNQEASYHRAFMDSNACVKDLPTIIEAEVSE